MTAIDRDPAVERARTRALNKAADSLAATLAGLGFQGSALLDPNRRDQLDAAALARLAGDVAHWRRAVEHTEIAVARLANAYGASWALIGAAVCDEQGNPMPRQNARRKYAPRED